MGIIAYSIGMQSGTNVVTKVAKKAEIEFTRQIEADGIWAKVTDDFKEAVAREFRRIAYTGTMGWRKKLNRPAHEVALGIWLARLN